MSILDFLQRPSEDGRMPHTHPVTRPDFTLAYEGKDITADIAPYLLSLSYTDFLEGQSDEVQAEFEDTDGRWLRGWYPEQGDRLTLKLGDRLTGLVALGSFEIAEIEYSRPPAVVRLKALAAGISKAHRTLQPKPYRNTTLAAVVRTVAGRLKLKVTGTVSDIKIKSVMQYQERDVEFLSRLAKMYGHVFKITGDTLVFDAKAGLAKREETVVLRPEDIIRVRLRDLIKGVPEAAVVRAYNPKSKKTVLAARKAKPRRPQAKRGTGADTLKIIPNRGESQHQLNARADAALADAQEEQCAGDITLTGNALLVAGQTVRLKDFGKFSGKYLVKQARHELGRGGYTTDLEIKMVEYVADDSEQPQEQQKEQQHGQP